MASPTTSAAGQAGAALIREGRRAGPIVLLSIALICMLGILVWERWHGEKAASAMLDLWTGKEQKAYEEKQQREREALEAQVEQRLRKVEDAATRTTEALDGIRREQARQGSQLDRVLERLPPK